MPAETNTCLRVTRRSPRRALTGTRLGPYQLHEQLGAGGLGEVYRATDTRLRRDVAIKILPAATADDPQQRARLLRELQLICVLNHPHMCALHDGAAGESKRGDA